MKIYICETCGNIAVKLTDSGVPMVCCGKPMQLLEAGVKDAAVEKHVPAVTAEGSVIRAAVGSVAHPMTEEHHIAWVLLETENGFQVRRLKPGQAPEAAFVLAEGEKAAAVYAYCNLHGLWKTEL